MNDPRNYSQHWMRSNFFPDFEITGGHWSEKDGYHLFRRGEHVCLHPVQDELEGRADSVMVYGYLPDGAITGQTGAWVRQLVHISDLRALQDIPAHSEDALAVATQLPEYRENDTVPGAQRAYYDEEGQH